MELIDIIFSVLMICTMGTALSMEYYARKYKVSASPSVPWMRRQVIKTLTAEIARSSVKNPVILELGAGWGTLALAAARACPDSRIIAYEVSPVPILFARIRAFCRGLRNITFIKGSFYDGSFADADFVLTYLTENLMKELRPKFEAELKSGATLITNTFIVPDWTPDEIVNVQKRIYELNVYIYRR